MSQAFSGIRIIDFTQVLAGPFATQQLALLGADVIKIEERTSGDQTRGLLNDTPGSNPSMAPSFMSCNLGKRSLTLDLKSPHAEEIVHRLVSGADVVVENFRAGVMDRLGFGYEALQALKGDLIYCSVSGYGQEGPKAGTPAYDGAIQAASGMMAITGHPETGPTRTGYMPVDMGTALNTAFAISAALYRRLATGEGQRLDVAMMDTAMVLQTPQVSNYLVKGVTPELFGNKSPTGQPTANSFATSDGYLNIVALKEPQTAALFRAIGREEVLEDERLKSAPGRMKHYDEVAGIIGAEIQQRPTSEWLEIFAEENVPAAPIRSYSEVVADPQFEHRQVFIRLPNPVEGAPTIDLVRAGYGTDQDGPDTDLPPPQHGEHTDEVLLELGYDQEAITTLRAEQVI
jgi:crotonobetainyl-CoA:carnitine CoA-transferase CaiB-like acyl-CoA transferase